MTPSHEGRTKRKKKKQREMNAVDSDLSPSSSPWCALSAVRAFEAKLAQRPNAPDW